MKHKWNSKEIEKLIKEISKLPLKSRTGHTDSIKKNFRQWVTNNFDFSNLQKANFEKISTELINEAGFMLASFIERNYVIAISINNDTQNPGIAKWNFSGGYNQHEGFFVEISYDC